MNEKNISNNVTSYDKDDILKEIEKELNRDKVLKNDTSNEKSNAKEVKSNVPYKNKKVNKILNNKDDLAKGILLSEILGKPKGRR